MHGVESTHLDPAAGSAQNELTAAGVEPDPDRQAVGLVGSQGARSTCRPACQPSQGRGGGKAILSIIGRQPVHRRTDQHRHPGQQGGPARPSAPSPRARRSSMRRCPPPPAAARTCDKSSDFRQLCHQLSAACHHPDQTTDVSQLRPQLPRGLRPFPPLVAVSSYLCFSFRRPWSCGLLPRSISQGALAQAFASHRRERPTYQTISPTGCHASWVWPSILSWDDHRRYLPFCLRHNVFPPRLPAPSWPCRPQTQMLESTKESPQDNGSDLQRFPHASSSLIACDILPR
jgi:hypothetical protein